MLFHNPNHNLLPTDGCATLHLNCFDTPYFKTLLAEIEWQEETLTIFGKKHLVPRLMAYYGSHNYVYSGVNHPAQTIPDILQTIQGKVEEIAQHQFNAVLCNRYRNGTDSMGWHRDNEPEMDQTCIASVSFGTARKFKFRHRELGTVVNVELPPASILVMRDCQQMWEHAVPKSKKVFSERINLTFRAMR